MVIEVLIAAERIFMVGVILYCLLVIVSAYLQRPQARRPELFRFLVLQAVIVIVAAGAILIGSLVFNPL